MIKKIRELSGSYSGYEIFSDWIKAEAISISNCSDVFRGGTWKKREEQFVEISKKHGKEVMEGFAELSAMLTMTLEENMEDVLGKIYMEAGLGSKETGQFFTPFHLSEMTAKLGFDVEEIKRDNRTIYLNEPSTGGGGMIIAAAKVLKDEGIDYQRRMDVVAQDLDWKGVYMTYVQLSLLGIKATCVQGNALEGKIVNQIDPERVLRTPTKKGVLLW